MSARQVRVGAGALASLAFAALTTGASSGDEIVVPSQPDSAAPQSLHEVPIGSPPPSGTDPGGIDPSANSSPVAVNGNGGASASGDSLFPPRGISLVPPYNGTYICFRRDTRTGYWCRILEGVDRLGDHRDFVVGFSSVYKKSEWHNTYGRTMQSHGGWYYEGCRQRDSSSYRCDFRSRKQMAPMTTNQSSGFELQVLRQWASHQKNVTGPCAANIVGIWVGANDLGGIISACRGAGPYPGYRPPAG